MKNKILIIDIETTGFLPTGKICEIGIVELDIETGNKRILFDSLCNPGGLTIDGLSASWIVERGYIAADEILSAVPIETIVDRVQGIINSYPSGATAFNNRFDFDFLETVGVKIPKRLPCPMLLSTNICKLPGNYGYKRPKVEEAYKFFFPDSEYIEKHRGADDAFHEADIVFKLIEMKVFNLN